MHVHGVNVKSQDWASHTSFWKVANGCEDGDFYLTAFKDSRNYMGNVGNTCRLKLGSADLAYFSVVTFCRGHSVGFKVKRVC